MHKRGLRTSRRLLFSYTLGPGILFTVDHDNNNELLLSHSLLSILLRDLLPELPVPALDRERV